MRRKHNIITNMKKIVHFIAVIAVNLMLQSCNDSFMERQPKTEIGVERFFNTEEDLKMYCYYLYDFPGLWSYVADEGTDNQATTSITGIKNIMISTNPTSVTINAGWSWGRLRDINLFLENCNKADVSEDILSHYKGVIRFFRARFYMDKVKTFSDVPWYEKTLNTDDEDLYKTRDSRAFVVQKIFEDFQYAAENVKDNRQKGEVDKWTVLAYMSRCALYEGTYRKYHNELNLQQTANSFLQIAANASKQIIDGGKFSLYNTGKPESDYYTLFSSADLSNNPEIILGRFYERQTLDNGYWAFMFGNYESCPAKDLVQSYLMKDGSYYSSQPDYKTKLFTEEFENRDARLYQTYAYPGWELVNTMNYAPGAGIYVQNFSKNFTGYHQIKGFINNRDQDFYLGVDFPVIRYAEILLTRAEALAELGTITENDLNNTINIIRQRAGMPALSISPAIDPVMQESFPNVPALLLEIRRERRVELALEGFRFDDLMRWEAGKLLEKGPEGLYFPSLGKFDLTGDGIEDIYLIPSTQDIPAEAEKEENSLGSKLVYYKTGTIDDNNATIYLTEGTKGNVLTIKDIGTFKVPQYYYRPIPKHETELNPNLLPQLFGWE